MSKRATNSSAVFELARLRIEQNVPKPAIIAITSPTTDDGRELASRALTVSFSMAGYSSMLIETTGITPRAPVFGKRPTSLAELCNILDLESQDERAPLSIEFCDQALQKQTTTRDVISACAKLREKYDYVILTVDPEPKTPFTESVLLAADAILLTVRKGRSYCKHDRELSSALGKLGERFLGILFLSPELIQGASDTNYSRLVRPGCANIW